MRYGHLILFLLLSSTAFGQTASRPIVLGFGLSTFGYSGDLSQGDDANALSAGVGFTLEVASEKTVRPQLNVGFGRFTAQYRDLVSPVGGTPNTFVDTKLFYACLLLQGHLFKERRIHPVIGVGLGLLGFTPNDANGASLVEQTSTRAEAETYGTTSVMVPLNIGFTGNINDRLSAQLRYQYIVVGSDYLDNVSELGNAAGNDGLTHFQLLLQVKLGK